MPKYKIDLNGIKAKGIIVLRHTYDIEVDKSDIKSAVSHCFAAIANKNKGYHISERLSDWEIATDIDNGDFYETEVDIVVTLDVSTVVNAIDDITAKQVALMSVQHLLSASYFTDISECESKSIEIA